MLAFISIGDQLPVPLPNYAKLMEDLDSLQLVARMEPYFVGHQVDPTLQRCHHLYYSDSYLNILFHLLFLD